MGLQRTASSNDVRKAYKKLALKFHPDKALSHSRFAIQLGPCGAPLQMADKLNARIRSQADLLFGLINMAHNTLMDGAERAKLDRNLYASDDPMGWMRSTDYSYSRRQDSYYTRADSGSRYWSGQDPYGSMPRASGSTSRGNHSKPKAHPRTTSGSRRSAYHSTGARDGYSDQSDGEHWDHVYHPT
eukprot:jgi/Botrbrau1/8637/Bobra.0196s0031.1